MEFVVFAVGLGGLKRARPRVQDLLAEWNPRLARKGRGLHLSQGFGHTGNFLLRSERTQKVSNVSKVLSDVLGRKFAVFTTTEFQEWLGELKAALASSPEAPPGRRATPGVVMNVNPTGGLPPIPSSRPWVVFGPFARPRIRGVWKLDRLRPDGRTLDRHYREGGWGAVAGIIRDLDGGDWTARALSSLEGVARGIVSIEPAR